MYSNVKMNPNVKIDDLINREQITNETEALFKYLLKVKRINKLAKLIKNSPNNSNQKEIMRKKITKLYIEAINNEKKLYDLDAQKYEVTVKYDAMSGFDTEETYYDKIMI